MRKTKKWKHLSMKRSPVCSTIFNCDLNNPITIIQKGEDWVYLLYILLLYSHAHTCWIHIHMRARVHTHTHTHTHQTIIRIMNNNTSGCAAVDNLRQLSLISVFFLFIYLFILSAALVFYCNSLYREAFRIFLSTPFISIRVDKILL